MQTVSNKFTEITGVHIPSRSKPITTVSLAMTAEHRDARASLVIGTTRVRSPRLALWWRRGRRRQRGSLRNRTRAGYWLCFSKNERMREREQEDDQIRQRVSAEISEPLKNQDLVPLDGVEVVVHGQEDLRGRKQTCSELLNAVNKCNNEIIKVVS